MLCIACRQLKSVGECPFQVLQLTYTSPRRLGWFLFFQASGAISKSLLSSAASFSLRGLWVCTASSGRAAGQGLVHLLSFRDFPEAILSCLKSRRFLLDRMFQSWRKLLQYLPSSLPLLHFFFFFWFIFVLCKCFVCFGIIVVHIICGRKEWLSASLPLKLDSILEMTNVN